MQYIRDIEPAGGRNEGHPTEENLAELVEAPLLTACRALVRKNIRTLSSSANKNNVGNSASIIIDAEHLSRENRETLERLGALESRDGHWGHTYTLSFPVSHDTTDKDVSDHFATAVDKLSFQPYTWAEKWTFADQLEMIYGKIPEETRAWIITQDTVEHTDGTSYHWPNMVQEAVSEGAFYDAETGCLYANKSEFDREKAD